MDDVELARTVSEIMYYPAAKRLVSVILGRLNETVTAVRPYPHLANLIQ